MPHLIGRFEKRIPIERLGSSRHVTVAGNLTFRDGRWEIKDQTGFLHIPPQAIQPQLDEAFTYWAALEKRDSIWSVLFHQVQSSQNNQPAAMNHYPEFHQRFAILQATRSYFNELDFQEVDTPVMVTCPGMEPYLEAFSVEQRYLRTSPELHMKQLLCAGWDRIFQLAPSFRNEPESRLHHHEFIMLEWYRSFADLNDLIKDTQGLLHSLASYSIDPDYFQRDIAVWQMPDLFLHLTGIELREANSKQQMRRYLKKKELHYCDDDSWDDLFFRVFLTEIEPKLGIQQPEIVSGYPLSQSALAKANPISNGKYKSCYRFELFIKGIECANAFYELCDPLEQEKRYQEASSKRRSLGKAPYPSDAAYMDALRKGMPPSAGIALGMDRLIMLLLGKNSLKEIARFYSRHLSEA
ncbi:MAG: EF-P lysine aminoacylase GenX [Acidobacteria bacterium]|nr:MAG: EF-P lysine aminoacylase GenX [Acidobacteriota bacterium]